MSAPKTLPINLNYSNIKPVGYPSHIKIQSFQPTAFSSANTADSIRFNINAYGFWDPYSAYVKFEVDTSDMDTLS